MRIVVKRGREEEETVKLKEDKEDTDAIGYDPP